MNYIYIIKNKDLEKIKNLGYETLPEEICEAPENENYYFKEVIQPKDGMCVKGLIKMYNTSADTICNNEKYKQLHENLGIKFEKVDGKYELIQTDELIEMFRHWRIELDLTDNEVYFTISDGAVPSFYDAENVLDICAPNEIKELLENEIIEKVEVNANGDIVRDAEIIQ